MSPKLSFRLSEELFSRFNDILKKDFPELNQSQLAVKLLELAINQYDKDKGIPKKETLPFSVAEKFVEVENELEKLRSRLENLENSSVKCTGNLQKTSLNSKELAESYGTNATTLNRWRKEVCKPTGKNINLWVEIQSLYVFNSELKLWHKKEDS